MISANEALKMVGLRPEDTRVVVQGAGNVGGLGAMLLHREGFKITSISDMYGYVVNERGLDMPAVLTHLGEHRTLECYEEADYFTNGKDQLELDCDLLVPAATENQITSENADRIKAKLIVEGANGPTTAAASDMLSARGVTIVPDILANAGGVTVSYFEWCQNISGYYWNLQTVHERLGEIMSSAFNSVYDLMESEGVPMRPACYAHALNRLADAME